MQEEIAEYNRMLRAGASNVALRAQREKINATIKEREETVKKRKIAEGELEVAQDGLSALEEREALQERVLAQLIEFGQMLAKVEDKERSLRDTIADVVDEQLRLFDSSWFAEVDLAFEELKNTMRDRFREITAPLKDWWYGEPFGIMDAMGNIIFPEYPGMARMEGARDVFIESLKSLKELADSDVLPTIADSLGIIATKLAGTEENFEKTKEQVTKGFRYDIPNAILTGGISGFMGTAGLPAILSLLGIEVPRVEPFPILQIIEVLGLSSMLEIREWFEDRGYESGANWIDNILKGLVEKQPDLLSEIQSLGTSSTGTLAMFGGTWLQLGINAANFYADGIWKAKPQVDAAVKNIMNVPDVVVRVRREYGTEGTGEIASQYEDMGSGYPAPPISSGQSQGGNVVNIEMNAEVSSDMDVYETGSRIVETVKRELIR